MLRCLHKRPATQKRPVVLVSFNNVDGTDRRGSSCLGLLALRIYMQQQAFGECGLAPVTHLASSTGCQNS